MHFINVPVVVPVDLERQAILRARIGQNTGEIGRPVLPRISAELATRVYRQSRFLRRIAAIASA